MSQFDVHPGDRIRFLSATRPNEIRNGTLEQIMPTPDGKDLLYIIREDNDDPKVAAVTVIDTPRIMLMERIIAGRLKTRD